MALKIHLRCTASGLVPLYDEDYDAKRRLKVGHDYLAEIREPRNIRFHRKYFALINAAWDLLSPQSRDFFRKDDDLPFDNICRDRFRKTLEVACGWSEQVYSITRKEWLEAPRSIAFDKMTAEEFESLYNNVFHFISTRLLRDTPQEELDNLIRNYI